jgi:hypothetical protein
MPVIRVRTSGIEDSLDVVRVHRYRLRSLLDGAAAGLNAFDHLPMDRLNLMKHREVLALAG